jgi:hypothetical protein
MLGGEWKMSSFVGSCKGLKFNYGAAADFSTALLTKA